MKSSRMAAAEDCRADADLIPVGFCFGLICLGAIPFAPAVDWHFLVASLTSSFGCTMII